MHNKSSSSDSEQSEQNQDQKPEQSDSSENPNPTSTGFVPTPSVCGNHNRKGASPTSGDGLATWVKKNGSARFWPTPSTFDTIDRKQMRPSRAATNRKTGYLSEAMLPDYMTTSSHSTEPTTPELTCSQGDFLANLSVSPGSEKARQMTVRSGLKCSALLTAQNPVGSLVRTLLESSAWNSTISFLTWKASATPRGRLLFRLVPSMPDTDATEFGLWPTPHANCNTGAGSHGTGADNIQTAVKMWPTPTAHLHKETNAPSERARNEPSLVSVVSGGTKATGSLNPAWVEWLMGYPIGHTACEGWVTRLSHK